MTKPDPEFVAFLREYPTYPTTHIIDDLRAVEYARLNLGGHVYLDYTGGGLYADSQLRRHHRLLAEHVFGNPHSSNPSSQAATQLVEHAREYVLKFFNADPDEYIAVFTSNASGALKLDGDASALTKLASTMVDFDPRFQIMPGTKIRDTGASKAQPGDFSRNSGAVNNFHHVGNVFIRFRHFFTERSFGTRHHQNTFLRKFAGN